MKFAIVGDFADALSFLASQRVEKIRSLGLAELRWLAVESDRLRPLPGRPLDAVTGEMARQLALPSEVVPAVGSPVPNSRAATAAYAESLTDGVPDAMRRALFDALWVQRQRVDDPDVIRRIVFRVLNPNALGDIDARLRSNQPIVPLGDPDPFATTRRLGFIVSMGRGPLTVEGQDRIDLRRRLWQARGVPALPLLLPDRGEASSGEAALRWLAALLPHRPDSTTEAAPSGAAGHREATRRVAVAAAVRADAPGWGDALLGRGSGVDMAEDESARFAVHAALLDAVADADGRVPIDLRRRRP